jgi:hypothetical protein
MAINFTITPAIQQSINELEILRKEVAAHQLKGWIAIAAGIVIGLVLFNFADPIVGILVGLAIIIYGGVVLYRISDEAEQYKNRFKVEIIGAALTSIDPTITMEPDNGISESEFDESQLFSHDIDRYSTEDLVKGQSGKTKFYFAEVHAEYKTQTQTKNGTRTTWHDILKGIVFVADFNKNFEGVTVIRPKDFGSAVGAWFSKNIFSVGDKKPIELESEVFNQTFVTYGTDPIGTRYILTPAMMERICELNARSADTISLSFINSCLYMAFPLSENYFEPPVFTTLHKPDLLEKDLSILGFMYALVAELDLNTRIWTKE